jgi:hypothetical protein
LIFNDLASKDARVMSAGLETNLVHNIAKFSRIPEHDVISIITAAKGYAKVGLSREFTPRSNGTFQGLSEVTH